MTQIFRIDTMTLRAAQRLPDQRGGTPRYELTSEAKRIARHMAWEGATAFEIAAAIKWPRNIAALRKQLKECNIRTVGIMRFRAENRR